MIQTRKVFLKESYLSHLAHRALTLRLKLKLNERQVCHGELKMVRMVPFSKRCV